MYKILFLISGSLRTFKENIKYLPLNCDIAVYSSPTDEDTYLNDLNSDFLFKDPRIKFIVFESQIEVPSIFSERRQQNIYKQWYKLHKLFSVVNDTYDIYVRMRPDIRILNTHQFEEIISYKSENLRIPCGNDRDGINDQICIGSYSQLKDYCSVFNLFKHYIGSPAENLSKCTSELVLGMHLSCPIERVTIDYKLILSTAKVICITGDSGSGKTTLCNIIKPLFLFDNVLEFETDRYHRWERDDDRWKDMSHLNPQSNFLEKLEEDTFNLKIGNSIIAVDYDHSTGKFTPPKPVEPSENILLCGLHTLYSNNLRELSNLKIFMDTDQEVKNEWKIKRDVHERGYSIESVVEQINKRKSDYEKYILPQREFADLIIKYRSTSLVLIIRGDLFNQDIHIECDIKIADPWKIFTFIDPNVNVECLVNKFIESRNLPSFGVVLGYAGVIQYILLVLLYK